MTEPSGRQTPDPTASLVQEFERAQVDYVPDPLVLRVADLFIGGTAFVPNIHPNPDIGLDMHAKITPSKVWETIDKNVDGLIAFFHLLMTRERVPLIDYDMTFNTQNFGALGNIAVPVHPPHDVYQQFKKDAQRKTAEMDFGRLPGKMVEDIAGELVSSGYEWLPEAGVDLVDPSQRTAATFLMGGLIFGSYAAAIRGDHLLQTKRARLFMELTIAPEARPQWGWKKEGELFAELDKMALQDPDVIGLRDRPLPPTVLTLLIEGSKNSRDLLDRAMTMRQEDEWKDYRRWYARLRKAWADGHHDASAEDDVRRVTEEIGKRLARQLNKGEPVPLTQKEIAIRGDPEEIKIKGKAGVNVGLVKAEVEIDNLQRIRLPEPLRKWYVDTFVMRDHRKLLMRMALAQQGYEKLSFGLRNLWEGRRADS
jgi:hypothetical protein